MTYAETRAKKSEGTITIKRSSPVETIEAVIPAKPGLIREVLASLPKPRRGSRSEPDREEFYFPGSRGMSPFFPEADSGSILRRPRFKELFRRLGARHSGWVTLTVKVRNSRVLDLTGKRPEASATLDMNEWREVARTFCDTVVIGNVEAAIICVRGSIPEEEKQLVLDRLCHQLPPVEVHRFTEGSNAIYTRIEAVLFGTDVSREKGAEDR